MLYSKVNDLKNSNEEHDWQAEGKIAVWLADGSSLAVAFSDRSKNELKMLSDENQTFLEWDENIAWEKAAVGRKEYCYAREWKRLNTWTIFLFSIK